MFFDSSKRKNDEKPKGRPRRVFLIGAGIALCLMIAAPVFLMRTPGYKPMSDVPTAKLLYSEKSDTYAIDFQTGERTLTTVEPDPYTINSISHSPDGRWEIRFELVTPHQYTNSYLLLEDLTGKEPLRNLGTFYGADSTLSWSPDQQWVAFTAYDPGVDTSAGGHAAEIWMIHLQTGEVKPLSHNTYLDSDPFFSPDGAQIVYISAKDGFPRVYVMSIATGESRLLTPEHYGDNPKWSPDGEWIAFEAWYRVDLSATDYTNYTNVYVVRVDGRHIQSVTLGKTEYSYLSGWRP